LHAVQRGQRSRALSALATGYIKASDTSAGAQFGSAVAVSGDGKTVAIGAHSEGDGGQYYVYIAPSQPSARAESDRHGLAVTAHRDRTTKLRARARVGCFEYSPSRVPITRGLR